MLADDSLSFPEAHRPGGDPKTACHGLRRRLLHGPAGPQAEFTGTFTERHEFADLLHERNRFGHGESELRYGVSDDGQTTEDRYEECEYCGENRPRAASHVVYRPAAVAAD